MTGARRLGKFIKILACRTLHEGTINLSPSDMVMTRLILSRACAVTWTA